MKRKYVSKEEIIELFINQNLSIDKTREQLGICRKVMYDYLKEYHIEKSSKAKFEARSQWTSKYRFAGKEEKLIEQVKELYVNQQKTSEECMSLLGISRGKLNKLAKQLNYRRPIEVKLANMEKTCLERYGVKRTCELPQVRLKQHKSKIEDECYQLLLTKFSPKNIIRQYKSKIYPFPCDFYIKNLFLYLEFNPGPRHHGRAYNELSNEDQKELQELIEKSKESDWYEGVIRTWTIRDPLKRKVAQENNLNWKEFFTLDEVKAWLETV